MSSLTILRPILLTSVSNLVKCFVTTELMRWPGIEALYGGFLRKTPVFSQEKRWEDLHTRVVEHVSLNINVNCNKVKILMTFDRTSVLLLNIIPASRLLASHLYLISLPRKQNRLWQDLLCQEQYGQKSTGLLVLLISGARGAQKM